MANLYGSQRMLGRPPRPTIAGVFNDQQSLELTSEVRPGAVSAFLDKQQGDTYVRAVGKPPRLFTTADGTDLLARQKLQRYMLANVIGPVERLRGNEESIARLKVELQPGTPGMTTERMRRALAPLCDAEQLRKQDQSSYMTAWENNQPVFEQYIKTYDFFVVRVVLSWLEQHFDQTDDGEMSSLLTRAIFHSRLIDAELAILVSVANDLSENKTWMSKAAWPDDDMNRHMLALLGRLGRCASEIRRDASLPKLDLPPAIMHRPVVPVAYAGPHAGAATQAGDSFLKPSPEKERPPRKLEEVNDDIDTLLKKFVLDEDTPPTSASASAEKPLVHAELAEAVAPTQAITTSITATEPSLSAKKKPDQRDTAPSPEKKSARNSDSSGESVLPGAQSAPSLTVHEKGEPTFLQTTLESKIDGDARSGRKRTPDAHARTGRHKRRSMSPGRSSDTARVPTSRGQRNSFNIESVLPPVKPRAPLDARPSPAPPPDDGQLSFQEILAQEPPKKPTRYSRIRRLSQGRHEKKVKQKTEATRVTSDESAAPIKGLPGPIWDDNFAKVFYLFDGVIGMSCIAKILFAVQETEAQKTIRDTLKIALNRTVMKSEEKAKAKLFLTTKLAQAEVNYRSVPDGEVVMQYLRELSKMDF